MAFNAVHTPMEVTARYSDRFPDITDPKRKALAGMLSAMDDAVGRVLLKVRQLGQKENTLVMFYSDNGGITPQNASRNDPLRGLNGAVLEGGIRVPFAMQWKGTMPAGSVYRKMVMGFDVHATALAAAGVTVSEGEPLDGVDLLPFVTGQIEVAPHDRLFWRSGRQHAVRLEDWKLVHFPPASDSDLLFNLADDIGEQHDLAATRPEKLKELQAAYALWDGQMMAPQWIRQDSRNAEPGGKLKETATPRSPGSRSAPASRIEQIFREADKNGDGKISKDEFPRPENFSRVDTNGDGFATLEEIRARFRNGAGQPAPPEASNGDTKSGEGASSRKARGSK